MPLYTLQWNAPYYFGVHSQNENSCDETFTLWLGSTLNNNGNYQPIAASFQPPQDILQILHSHLILIFHLSPSDHISL